MYICVAMILAEANVACKKARGTNGDTLVTTAQDGSLALDVPPKKGNTIYVLRTECLLRVLRFEGRFSEVSMYAHALVVSKRYAV